MKYALIENNIVKMISYQPVEGWEEVADTVFADMVKQSDGTFDDSDEVKAQKLQSTQDATDKENKKASAKQKLKDLGLTDDEIKALIGA
jgi:phosphosulfolactate phosphohydrolase-like enzyme